MRSIALRVAAAASTLVVVLPGSAVASEESSAQTDCKSGPYIVFFDSAKSDVTPEAATILDSAIAAYKDCNHAQIRLAGYADRAGGANGNVRLSMRRNASVQDYLTSHGVPVGALTSQALGETMPRVPTADGVREPQNRHVEITYRPGSGQ